MTAEGNNRTGSHTVVQYLMDWLHWLPSRERIDFKIATLTYKTPSSGHLAYLR